MPYSKGNWKIGNNHGVVVTDNHEGFRNPENGLGVSSGHSDIAYYGGYLICESVMKPDDAKLIAAAPELLEACNQVMYLYKTDGHLLNFNIDIIRLAIDKATGG